MSQQVTCPDCGGSGKIITDKCPECGGRGYKHIKRDLEVNIPAGINQGQQILIKVKVPLVLMVVQMVISI